jgi:hypothetical protein
MRAERQKRHKSVTSGLSGLRVVISRLSESQVGVQNICYSQPPSTLLLAQMPQQSKVINYHQLSPNDIWTNELISFVKSWVARTGYKFTEQEYVAWCLETHGTVKAAKDVIEKFIRITPAKTPRNTDGDVLGVRSQLCHFELAANP